MKSQRHHAREVAFQFLYRFDLEGRQDDPTEEIERHFKHFKIPEDVQVFARDLIKGTLRERQELDRTIEATAANWKVARMPFVDRNLLRMSLYELTHNRETPASVTIDEAVELAKQFGTADTAPFINGILDACAKNL
jgi:N utilization substance protein B